MTRHGGNMHFMRPDRVYATSVIAPIGGYYPEQDVQAVAAMFTQGPYYFSQGNGALGAVRLPSFFERIKYRVQAAIASSKAKKFMRAAALHGAPPVAMPAAAAGPRIAPQAYSRLQMLATMAQMYQPSDWSAYNTDVTMQRFANLRAATR